MFLDIFAFFDAHVDMERLFWTLEIAAVVFDHLHNYLLQSVQEEQSKFEGEAVFSLYVFLCINCHGYKDAA
jgi:hypothetical protein